MTRKNQFNYGFDEKPDFVKQAEREEVARLERQRQSRQQFADAFRSIMPTAFGWSNQIRVPHGTQAME